MPASTHVAGLPNALGPTTRKEPFMSDRYGLGNYSISSPVADPFPPFAAQLGFRVSFQAYTGHSAGLVGWCVATCCRHPGVYTLLLGRCGMSHVTPQEDHHEQGSVAGKSAPHPPICTT